jgi:hypothetical protein
MSRRESSESFTEDEEDEDIVARGETSCARPTTKKIVLLIISGCGVLRTSGQVLALPLDLLI